MNYQDPHDVRKADIETAMINRAEDEHDELVRLREMYREERRIVERVWIALGITTYEQAKPYTIDEHVVRLRAELAETKRQLGAAVVALRMDSGKE